MVLITSNQDLTAASGLIDMSCLEQVYHSIMDEATLDLGRIVTFHLQPQITQDTVTQGQPQAGQYNPFFGGVVAPNTNTRTHGTRITPRDVQYLAHIRVGPTGKDDLLGIGDLKDNQIQLTVVIEALPHVLEAITFTVEGRRYQVDETRPIGFTVRRYLMIKGTEINEQEAPSPDGTVG